MQYIASFFNEPRNTYGLQTISTENSLAPIYEYFVMPIELMDLYTALGGNITTKKIDDGWIATIISYKDLLRTVSYPPITFKTFVGRDENALLEARLCRAKDEAINWFKERELDITDLSNWLVEDKKIEE